MITKIHIEPGKTIKELQIEFSRIYPYIKIEFFKEQHVAGKGSAKNKIISNDVRLGSIQKIDKPGTINVNSKSSVSDLEQVFEKKFGLYIQVFRKSGNVWLETSATDNWSLAQQNEEGEMLAKHFNIEKENQKETD